ncbi:MAG: hypothetical protein DME57_09395 [Verrucomicrobia bacterium]|nr:MAG: hypothetical protein DME57_09395 [Verrucomicrobiota bacterium]
MKLLNSNRALSRAIVDLVTLNFTLLLFFGASAFAQNVDRIGGRARPGRNADPKLSTGARGIPQRAE